MNDLPVTSNKLNTNSLDEKIKDEIKQFYEGLNSHLIKVNWSDGKIKFVITATQIFHTIDLSEEWLSHSKKGELEKQLLEGINYALDKSFDSASNQLKAFYKNMIESSKEIKHLIQTGASTETTEGLQKVAQAVKSEIIREKSINEDIVAVFVGGRRFSTIMISQELFDTKNGETIAGRLMDALNNAVNRSRNKLMKKFGTESSS
jgi:DNA-binding protein YbaB